MTNKPTCSNCLFREKDQCVWHEKAIDKKTPLCGGVHWMEKPAPYTGPIYKWPKPKTSIGEI